MIRRGSGSRLTKLFVLALLPIASACSTARVGARGTGVETVLGSTQQIAYELSEEDRLYEGPLVFRWPLERVHLTSQFGLRGRRPHQGVDMRASYGTPVVAALGGVVVYADDRISGYGETLILRHAQGVSTIYAHCSKLLVKVGDRVIGGQRIALSGDSGRATAPHLHFEVRDGMLPVDPGSVIHRWKDLGKPLGKTLIRVWEAELEEDAPSTDGDTGALTE